jgi:hypothetical protein
VELLPSGHGGHRIWNLGQDDCRGVRRLGGGGSWGFCTSAAPRGPQEERGGGEAGRADGGVKGDRVPALPGGWRWGVLPEVEVETVCSLRAAGSGVRRALE